ncbi:MAG: Na/Pi cotransporter family protein [Eubacterium sp.]|nr:Na/Pi cotransporter family protein [Eubacterium sp.]
MNLTSIVTIIGGLAFFLFGMHILSSSLKRVAGDRLEATLRKMTDHPLKGMLFGAIVTIAMQSSSALTVMLVGLVNSGIMTLLQTVGVIMGSNIGTTLTAWILSMSGIRTDNIFLMMLKPENFSPVIALIGIILIMVSKGQKKKDIGTVMAGFAILMNGMTMMSDSLAPLADNPEFTGILTTFRNPYMGVLIGMLFTAIIQSSAASIGVLQALSLTGQISYGIALPIIMGQNIGTCITALLSTIGVNKNAKRVSVIHICFNVIGTALGMIIYIILDNIVKLPLLDSPISPFAIAVFHSIFNIATTAILMPFSKALVRISERIIKTKDQEEVFLDERILLSPVLATSECRNKSVMILKDSTEGYLSAISQLEDYDEKSKDAVRDNEEKVDEMVDKCNSFLIKLFSKDISSAESKQIADMLHMLGDMERISDYSLNIMNITKKMNRDKFNQTDTLKEILIPINTEIRELLELLNRAYEENDADIANAALKKTEVLVAQIKKTKKTDIKLLRKGNGDAEASVYLSDYLSVSRRVVEHSENILEAIALA